jgi:hypothetical protein
MSSRPDSTPSGSVTPTATTPIAPVPTEGTGLPVTLTGTASRSASEGTCLVLTVAGRSYLLVGAVRNIGVGDRVTVTGHVDRGVVTTCQAGTPFVVQHVRATDPSTG